MENLYKKNHEEFSIDYTKIREDLDYLKEENSKYKEALQNISANVVHNDTKKITKIISSLNINNNISNNKILDNNSKENSNSKNNSNLNISLSKTSNIIDDEFLTINTEEFLDENKLHNKDKNTFAKKVIEEFDKVLNNELKRIEKNFKKFDKTSDSPFLKKRTSMSQRRFPADKNYIVWKRKSTNELFHEYLRTPERQIKNDLNKSLAFNNPLISSDRKKSTLNQSTNLDIDGMINQAKQRVRNSISNNKNTNIPSISNFSFQENSKRIPTEAFTKKNNDRENSLNRSDFLNNSKMSYNYLQNINLKKQTKDSIERE